MGYHEEETLIKGLREAYMGRCSCGAASLWVKEAQQVEDFFLAHRAQVERARAATRRRASVPLVDQYQHFDNMSKNTEITENARQMWVQLRDELGHRLGYNAPPSEQLELLSVDDVKPKERT